MALDPQPRPVASTVIENEIPAYRAISPLAVLSLVLGLLSLLCFTDPSFLVVAALAVTAGLLADRKIQRMPDVLTGRRLAQAGVALGLLLTRRETSRGGWIALLLAAGAVGQTGIVNTFCHGHIPVFLSLVRAILGAVLGSVLGVAAWALVDKVLGRSGVKGNLPNASTP